MNISGEDIILVLGVGVVAVGGFLLFKQNEAVAASVTAAAQQASSSAGTTPLTYFTSAAQPASVGDTTGDTSAASTTPDNSALDSTLLSAINSNTTTNLAAISAESSAASTTSLAGIIGGLVDTSNQQVLAGKATAGTPESVYGYVDSPSGQNIVSLTYTGAGNAEAYSADPTLNGSDGGYGGFNTNIGAAGNQLQNLNPANVSQFAPTAATTMVNNAAAA